MFSRFVCTLSFILLSVFSFSQDVPKPDTTDAAIAFIKAGNVKCDSALAHIKIKDEKGANRFYKEAIVHYKKAVKTSDIYQAHYSLATTLVKIKDYKNALKSFDKALSLDPTKGDAFRERALAQLGLKKDTLAMLDLNKAIDLNFEDAEALYQRGLIKEKGRNPKSAFDDYARAIEAKPNMEAPLISRGKLYYNLSKDYVLAMNDFNRALEINPENNETYLWRGKTNFSGGDFKSADQDLSRYIDYEPNNIDALITRGASRININNNPGAVSDFDEVLKLDPKNYFAYMNRGTAKGAMKKFPEALEDLNKAIELKFDFSPAYLNRAAIKFASGDKKGACQDLSKADGLNNAKAYPLIQKYCADQKK